MEASKNMNKNLKSFITENKNNMKRNKNMIPTLLGLILLSTCGLVWAEAPAAESRPAPGILETLGHEADSRLGDARGELRDQVQAARAEVNDGIADKQAELGQRLKDRAQERSGERLKERVGGAAEGQMKDRASGLAGERAGERVRPAIAE